MAEVALGPLAPPPASALDVFPASKVRITTVIYLLRK